MENDIFQALADRCAKMESEAQTGEDAQTMSATNIATLAASTKNMLENFASAATEESIMEEVSAKLERMNDFVVETKKASLMEAFGEACMSIAAGGPAGGKMGRAEALLQATKNMDGIKFPAKPCVDARHACATMILAIGDAWAAKQHQQAATIAEAAEYVARALCTIGKGCAKLRAGCEMLMLGAASEWAATNLLRRSPPGRRNI